MMPIYKVDGAKKDGLQKYIVRINYTDDFGSFKTISRTTYGSEAAKTFERQLLSEVKDKGERYRRITIGELFNEYVSVKKHEVRESTIDKNQRQFKLYIEEKLSEVYLSKLNVPTLQEWKNYLNEKDLALKTKNHAYSILRAICNYAIKMEYTASNPLVKVGKFVNTSYVAPEMDYYTPAEFAKFIEKAKSSAEKQQLECNSFSEWNFYVFFIIAFYTGMRKGEINALKWSDVDGSFISVKRSINQKIKGEDRETIPKNHSSIRTIEMPLPMIQALNEQKERQIISNVFDEDKRICGGERCLRDSTLSNRNIAYANQAGLKVIRIHDFRHSHVSVLANMGINIQEIAKRLGHAKVEETWNRYSHMYAKEAERATSVLNNLYQ